MLFNPDNAGNIPDELKAIPGFVLWHRSPSGAKVPLRVVGESLESANAHDPASWMSFEAALDIIAASPDIGLGFDLQASYCIIGLDFDDCVVGGAIAPDVAELLAIAGSYAEISPSGAGVRLFGLGTLPQGCRKMSKLSSGIAVERYTHNRYLTLTGNGSPMPLAPLDVLMEILDASIFKQQPPKPRAGHGPDPDYDRAGVELFVSLLKPSRADDYHDWFRVGSCLAAFGDGAFSDLWLRWSALSPKFEPEQARRKWLSICKGTNVEPGAAFGTLLRMAQEDSGRSENDILAEVQARLGRPRSTHTEVAVVRSSRALAVEPADDTPIEAMSLPPRDRLAYRPFPVEALPEELRRFVEHGAAALCCDRGPLATLSLVTCSAAIGTTRRIAVKKTWRPYPILWGVLVASSGDLKTPIYELATQPIRDRQARLKQQWMAEKAAYDQELADYKAAKASQKDGEELPPEPVKPAAMARLMTADATVEALGGLLEANPRGLFVCVDELVALLGGMDRYKRGSSDEGFYLSSYGGLGHTIDRKTGEPKSIYIPRCALQIVGGIQPAKAQAVLDKERRSSGLVQRLLFAVPPRRAYRWSDDEISGAVLEGYAVLIDRLFELGDGHDKPEAIGMSREAREAFIDWTKEHSRHCRSFSPDLAAAASKLREIPARLGLILHLAGVAMKRHAEDAPVGVATMQAAISIGRWFRHEAERMFRLLEADPLTLGELLSVDAAGAAILETLWDQAEPMSRQGPAQALSPTPARHVVSALADLLHRAEIVRLGDGIAERWQAAPRATPEPLPTFSEFEGFAPGDAEQEGIEL